MRKAPDALDRPSQEELYELRRRLAGDDRADGAANLDDLAEAMGVPPESVRETLDRIREERAFRPGPKKDQRPMLAFAAFLLGSAFVIHRLNPRALSDDERAAQAEERLAEIRARRRSHPVVHYPIPNKVTTGAMPPSGFAIEMRGPLTTTTLAARSGLPATRAATVEALTAALANAYGSALDAEAAAPPPPRPIERKENWTSPFPPNAIALSVGNNVGYIQPERYAGMSSQERARAVLAEAGSMARSVVDGAVRSQESCLKDEPIRRSTYVALPPGFGLEFSGRQKTTIMSSGAIRVLPVDPEKLARKLETILRSHVWNDLVPPDFSTPESRAALAKTPTPEFADVTLKGPLASRRFRLPLTASARYPTAADAARAADRLIALEARRAAAQVRRAERGEGKGLRPTTPEIEALHRRLAPDAEEFDGAATVRDIAEATGLTESDVAAHLRQVRAETAFHEPEPARPSALPWIALGALAVGVGVTWWRALPSFDAFVPPSTASAQPVVVPPVQATPLTTQWNTDGAPRPSQGLRIEAIGQTSDHLSEGDYGEKRAIPYETVRDALVASATALVEATQTQEGEAAALPGTRYHGMDGGIFAPRKGFVRVAMSGWAGSDSAWIPVPLAPEGRARLRELAVKVLSDVKAEQDAALVPVADPSSGLVGPPPAFTVRFAGRRLDLQEGGRVSFAPIPREVVARRLEAAILNAVARDRRLPIGAWSGEPRKDARIPAAKLSRVEVMGPDGLATADVPTDASDPGATARSVRAFAARVAAGIDSINEKALEKDETARP